MNGKVAVATVQIVVDYIGALVVNIVDEIDRSMGTYDHFHTNPSTR